jgi:hypothetical protein
MFACFCMVHVSILINASLHGLFGSSQSLCQEAISLLVVIVVGDHSKMLLEYWLGIIYLNFGWTYITLPFGNISRSFCKQVAIVLFAR